MKSKKLLSLLLCALMLLSSFEAFAATEEENVFYATEDTYIVSGSRWENKNYGDASSMLFGSAYNRTALLKFDLSNADLSSFKGALLELNVRTASSGGSINIYTAPSDWTEKSLTWAKANQNYEFVVSYAIKSEGDHKIAFTLNRALEQAKENGSGIITLALKSDAECINVASSESSNVAQRPKITLTEDNAFIKGQLDFQFPQVSREMLKAEMEKVVAKGHPWLLANDKDIEKIREYAYGKDELLTTHWKNMKAKADELLTKDIIKIDHLNLNTQSYIGDGTTMWENNQILALVYLVEGDTKYARKAYQQAEYLAKLKTWGTYQRIDNIRAAMAVAICYDWCYDALTPDERETLVKGLRTLHLDEIPDLFRNPKKEEYKWSIHQAYFSSSNHGLMDCSLSFMAAMAICETDMDFMTDVMQLTMKQLEVPFNHWYPDSVWYEGAGYWNYAGPFTTRFIMCMRNAFGHSFGYDKIDCLLNVADHPIHANTTIASFIWGDTFKTNHNEAIPIMYSMGKLKGDIGLQKYAIDNADVIKNGADPIFALDYDPTVDYNEEAEFTLDKLFRNCDNVFMRSTWEGSQETWCAMGVQEIRPNNGMMNCGSIGFDAIGERWIMNPGRENYYTGYWNQDTTRYTWYRTRAEANSCLVINPSEFGGQNIDAADTIGVFESEEGEAFAIVDLTETYKGQVKSYRRGIGLFDSRNSFVVQDEFVLTEPSEVYSFFNCYLSEIEVLEDGKSAIVTKNDAPNKKMYVTVESDKEFTLSSMYAEPLPTSPTPPEPNSLNRDLRRLAIHFDKVDSANVRVCFTPYLCEEELSVIDIGEFVPMSEWKASETRKERPVLNDLKIKGTSVEGFNPADRCYKFETELEASDVTPVYDSSKYDVKVRKDEATDSVSILVIDKNDSKNINSYSIGVPIIPVPSFVDTSDMDVLTIADIQAPVPQAENGIENMFDGDLSTRWSGQGIGNQMRITLDKVHEIGCIGYNHYEGDQNRIQYFDVEVSDDGTTWTKIGMFESSGVTADMEYYDLGNVKTKYIRITYQGTNIGAWNSICELKVFGK